MTDSEILENGYRLAFEHEVEKNRELERRVAELEGLLRQTPHDEDCWPSEGIHSARCKMIRAALGKK